MSKNYTFNDYTFGKTTIRYVIMNDTKKVFMLLLPSNRINEVNDTYKTVNIDDEFSYNKDWIAGTLCYLHLSHHYLSPMSGSFKLGQSTYEMKFKSQQKSEDNEKTVIETIIESDEGYSVIHKVINFHGEDGFEVECTFVNNTGNSVRLEMITSATLDNLSPLNHDDDHSEDIYLHTFKSSWALEGTHNCQNLRELNLQKSWGGTYETMKFGSQGSRSTADYFPYAIAEDATIL